MLPLVDGDTDARALCDEVRDELALCNSELLCKLLADRDAPPERLAIDVGDRETLEHADVDADKLNCALADSRAVGL